MEKTNRENTRFVQDCMNMKSGEILKRVSLTFQELFNLKYPVEIYQNVSAMFTWGKFEIFAKTKNDVSMNVWNGIHPVDENCQLHTCERGTIVKVWMVSRFGDVGITDNLIDATGYNARVAVDDLYEWEFVRVVD